MQTKKDLTKVLYNIAHTVHTTKNLSELFPIIKNELNAVINTTNLYIALYNKKTGMITMPYEVDEKDKFTEFPPGKTLTAYVIKTGKSLLSTEEVTEDLIKEGEMEIIGAPSKIWLGTPLKIEGKVIGVVAVQSYTDASLYTEQDMKILEFVADEIALAIEHKRIEEEKEKLIKNLQNALKKIKTLSGLLPICSNCKKIRDDKGHWHEVETHVRKHSNADFSHTLCPDCMKKLYPKQFEKLQDKKGKLH